MISESESFVHLCGAAALATGMLGVGFGVIGPARRRRRLWIVAGAFGGLMTLGVANGELRFSGDEQSLLATGVGVLVGFTIGALLLRLGLCGRRVGDHPHCRRCGFDLVGRPESSVVCSECGAPLDSPNAIATGVLERRTVPLLTGTFVALLSLAIGVAGVRSIALRPSGMWMRMKPASWLLADLSASAYQDQQESMNELTRRLYAQSLGASDVKRFVLAATSGPAAPLWRSPFNQSPAIAAWSTGQLDDATMGATIKSLPTATLTLRPQSSPNRVFYNVMVDGIAPSYNVYAGGADWAIEVTDRSDTINGNAIDPTEIVGRAVVPVPVLTMTTPFSTFRPATPFARGAPPTPFGYAYHLKSPLPAGVATIAMRMNLIVTLGAPGRASLSVGVPVALNGTTTIVPTAAIPPSAPDPRMDAARATIFLAAMPGSGERQPRLSVTAIARDLDFTGDVFARDAHGSERLLGPIVLERGFGQMPLVDAMPAGDVMLVFRPRPERVEDLARPAAAYVREFVITPDRVRRFDRLATTRETPRTASRLAG